MYSLFGGALIGLAASILFLTTGRLLGVSGIVAGLLSWPTKEDRNWRIFLILGILSGGILLRLFHPDSFILVTNAKWYDYILAGLLVGFGTLMGNGCTSGHGVCGISRFSKRSIVSTITFICFSILGVLIAKFFRGGVL